tara:strand:+ start:572 stop:1267 length:696 start_codon:yes stop_codon:yes gene_type:complete
MKNKINLHYFFDNYLRRDLNHLRALEILEKSLPEEFLSTDAKWVKVYRGEESTFEPLGLASCCSFNIDECDTLSSYICLEYFTRHSNSEYSEKEYFDVVSSIDNSVEDVQTEALKKCGVESEIVNGFTFEDLEKEIKSKRPVIIFIKNFGRYNNRTSHIGTLTGNHPVVIAGLEDGEFIVNDTFGDMRQGYTSDPIHGSGIVYDKHDLVDRWDGRARIFKNKPVDNHGHLH